MKQQIESSQKQGLAQKIGQKQAQLRRKQQAKTLSKEEEKKLQDEIALLQQEYEAMS